MKKLLLLCVIALLFPLSNYAQWSTPALGTTQNLYSADYYSNDVVWIGSYDQIVTTSNGGLSWNLMGNPMINTSSISISPAFIQSILVTGPSTGLATGEFYGFNYYMVLSTANGGTSWAEPYLTTGSATIYLSSLDMNGSNAVAVGTNGTLLTSSNSGASWTSRTGFGTTTMDDVRYLTADTVIAVGTKNIYRSFDAGITWKDSAISAGTYSVVRTMKNLVYMTGYNGLIKSTNYGNSYSVVRVPFSLSGAIAIASPNILLAAGSNGLYISKTAGQYWEKCNIPKVGQVNMISCLDSNHAIAVGNSGYAVITTNLASAPTTPIAYYGYAPVKGSYCLGDSVTFTDSTANFAGYTYKWLLDGTVFSTQYNTGVRLNKEGTDTVMLIVSSATGSDTVKTTFNVIGHHINPLAISVVGNDTVCSGNVTGFEVANSQSGVSYQLRSGYTKIGSAVAGTGGIIVLPCTTALTAKKGFNIKATRTTSCFTDSLIGYDTVYVNTLSTPAAICPPANGTCSYVSIHNMSFDSIQNTTFNTYLVNDYFDYACCKRTSVHMNEKYPFSITTKCTFSGTWTYVWIDMNGDGNLTSNELVYSSYTDTTVSGTVTIPVTTYFNKPVRMRVSTYEYSLSSSSACSASGCGQTQDYAVTILPDTVKPTSKFTFTSSTKCSTGVTFTDSSYNATTYYWDFGDGTNSTLMSPPVHTYTVNGTYVITLITTNPYGSDTLKKSVVISNPVVPIADSCVPTAYLYACTAGKLSYVGLNSVWSSIGGSFTNDMTCTMQTHLIVDSSYTITLQGSGQTMGWIDYQNTGNLNDAGDKLYTGGNLSGSPVFYLPFTVPHNAVTGVPLRLRICSTSSTGYISTACDVLCGNYMEMTVFIDPYPIMKLAFTASSTSVCAGSPVTFTNKTTKANTYLWSFGDGDTTSSVNPVHTYLNPGTYSVKLKACNKFYCDSIIYSGYITVNPLPSVVLGGKTQLCTGSKDTLIASGGTTYTWSTGATTTSIIVSPTATTTYTVSVNNGTCTKDTSITVTVNALPAITITGDSAVCFGNSTTLTASGAANYLWMPGAGLCSSASSSTCAVPTSTTTYTCTGTDANGCVNSATRTITVWPSNGFDLTGALYICIDTPAFSNASIQACIFNNRCQPTSGTMKLIIDTAIHISSTIADSAAIVSGDTLIWHYDSLSNIGKTHCVTLSGRVDSLPASDSVFVTELISPVAGDSVPTNNSITYWVKPAPYNCVGLPYDPNEKAVYPEGNIKVTQQLSYTIHFQNTGNAIAHNVVVIDTLSTYLDPTTLKVTSSSSPVTTTMVSGHIAKFTFNNIDLPDTATSKTTSIGVFAYTIMPKTTDVAGDKITNRGGIYFDANPVVMTNATLNTIAGVVTGLQNTISSLNVACFPNPFSSYTNIVFNTDGKHYLEVDDVTGRTIKSLSCQGTQYELNRDGLAAGVYFIRAYNESKTVVSTIKIIVE